MNKITPENITKLEPNEIFVFGSNLQGSHAGGAARCAMSFGAKWGQGVGLQGQTYAIPTLSFPGKLNGHILPISTIKKYVNEFIKFAKANPDKTFLLTPIGCGIAGFTPQEIAPLFKKAIGIDNITLPQSFISCLETDKLSSMIRESIEKYMIEKNKKP